MVLLDQHGDSVHLRATNGKQKTINIGVNYYYYYYYYYLQFDFFLTEHMNDWLELSGGQKLDQADIDKDNIEEIFKGIQDRVLSITYRVSKKDSTTGGDRENYIMSWEDITEKVVL